MKTTKDECEYCRNLRECLLLEISNPQGDGAECFGRFTICRTCMMKPHKRDELMADIINRIHQNPASNFR
jgi:hypothetical protein